MPSKSLESQLSRQRGEGLPQRIPSEKLPRKRGDSGGKSDSEVSQLVCNACGFEEEFIDEGMYPCEKCHQVYYCSLECLKWDWKGGDHRSHCVGLKDEETLENNLSLEESTQSIEAFEAEPTILVKAESGQSGARRRRNSRIDDDELPPLKKPPDRFDKDNDVEMSPVPAPEPEPVPAPAPAPLSKFEQMRAKLVARTDNSANSPAPSPAMDTPKPKKSGGVQDRLKVFEKEDTEPQKLEWRSVNGRMALLPADAPKQQPPCKYRTQTPPPDPSIPVVNMEMKKKMDEEQTKKAQEEVRRTFKTHKDQAETLAKAPTSLPKKKEAPKPSRGHNEIDKDDGSSMSSSDLAESDEAAAGSAALDTNLPAGQTGTASSEEKDDLHVSLYLNGDDSVVSTLDDDEGWDVGNSEESTHHNKKSQYKQQTAADKSTGKQGATTKQSNSLSFLGSRVDSDSEEDDADMLFAPVSEADASAGGAARQRQKKISSDSALSSSNKQQRSFFSRVGSFFGGEKNISDNADESEQEQVSASVPAEKAAHAQLQQDQTVALQSGHGGDEERLLPTKDLLGPSTFDERPAFSGRPENPFKKSLDRSHQRALRHRQKSRNSQQRPQSSTPTIEESEARKCKACDIDFEFVSDGFIPCRYCQDAYYCTQDCLEWDWKEGGHGKACSGFAIASGAEPMEDETHELGDASAEVSIEPFESTCEEPEPESLPKRKCAACSMESDFVADGMLSCPRCSKTFYCSSDCLQWHWNSGGHKQSCKRTQNACSPMDLTKDTAGSESSSTHSIDAFQAAQDDMPGQPRTIMDQLKAAKLRTYSTDKSPESVGKKNKVCEACKMDEEFVADGMLSCSFCRLIHYCSEDCRQWHWKGGHAKVCKGAYGEALSLVSTESFKAPPIGEVDEASIELFDELSQQDNGPRSSKNEAANRIQPSNVSEKCMVCGMDKEFVPDGMIGCIRCHKVVYCSMDCLEWDWGTGGHLQVCSGLSDAERKAEKEKGGATDPGIVAVSVDAVSIDAFDHNGVNEDQGLMGGMDNARESMEETKSLSALVGTPHHVCQSCNMDSEFVPDGMIFCDQCKAIPYCSHDCMLWHWRNGGHARACEGSKAAKGIPMEVEENSQHSDLSSIDPFGGQDGSSIQSKSGAMVATNSSRFEAKAPKQHHQYLQCCACGTDSDFAADGMIMCPHCNERPYCSIDCLDWDLTRRGHKTTCKGLVGKIESSSEKPTRVSILDEDSIEPFDLPVARLKCTACGIDSEFVSDGMKTCSKCSSAVYCSSDCMNWDWNDGGHRVACQGISAYERQRAAAAPNDKDTSDEMSIDAFEEDRDQAQPQLPSSAVMIATRDVVGISGPSVEAEKSFSDNESSKAFELAESAKHIALSENNHAQQEKGILVVMAAPPNSKFAITNDDISIDSASDEMDLYSESLEEKANEEVDIILNTSDAAAPKGLNQSKKPPIYIAKKQQFSSPAERNKQDDAVLKTMATAPSAVTSTSKRGALYDMDGGSDFDDVYIETNDDILSAMAAPASKKCPAADEDISIDSASDIVDLDLDGNKEPATEKADTTVAPALVSPKRNKQLYTDKKQHFSSQTEKRKQDDAVLNSMATATFPVAPVSKAAARAVLYDVDNDSDFDVHSFEEDSKCRACGIESSCVSESMLPCQHCSKVQYCSTDCMEWDWNIGGHKESCEGASDTQKHITTSDRVIAVADKVSGDDSIEPFEFESATMDLASSASVSTENQSAKTSAICHSKVQESKPACSLKCHVCQMEEEFVEDGMVECPTCRNVAYCSDDCKNWDWENGGHKNTCEAASRNGVTGHEPIKCVACGIDSDFVSSDMISCNCEQLLYCSADCQQWHWNNFHKNSCTCASNKPQLEMTTGSASENDSIAPFDFNEEQVLSLPASADLAVATASSHEEADEATAMTVSRSHPTEEASSRHQIYRRFKTTSETDDNRKEEASHRFEAYRQSKFVSATSQTDGSPMEEASSRFQSYRQYLAAAIANYLPWTERDGNSIHSAAHLGHALDHGIDLEKGDASSSVSPSSDSSKSISSSSESTGLGSVPSSSDDESETNEKYLSILKKAAVVGAVQLAAPTDGGDLPTYMSNSTADVLPSSFDLGSEKAVSNSGQPLASPRDIESGQFADESAAPFVPNDVVESRKRYRNQCVVAHLLLVIAAFAIALGLGISFLGGDDDSDGPLEPASPVPTVILPPTQETTNAPSALLGPFPVSLSPSSTQLPSPLTLEPTITASSNMPAETIPPTPMDDATTLFNFLALNSFDNGASLNQTGSPQNQAFDWMLGDPGLVGYSGNRILQRYALATFYYSTSGDSWGQNNLWLSSQDECTWFSRSASFSVCESDEYVTLELDVNDLDGTVPNEIALLTKLERVELSGGPERFLSGSLPSELGLLTSLSYLSLRGNQISSTLPTELQNWSLLRTLNLSLNKLRGTIPSAIGGLSQLSEIFLGSNDLSGSLPSEIGQATNLFRISTGDNSLEGDVPAEIGQLTGLRYIYMEANKFESLPSEMGLLSNLIVMAFFENALAGRLLTEIGELSLLRSLLLANNEFNSTIPSEIGLLGGQLGNLDMSFNNFSGQIPSELGMLTTLRTIELQNNSLSGMVPAEFSGLERLNTIRVDSNMLTGVVPAETCETFNSSRPLFYADCLEIECECCTYCCDENECTCVHAGTELEFLC